MKHTPPFGLHGGGGGGGVGGLRGVDGLLAALALEGVVEAWRMPALHLPQTPLGARAPLPLRPARHALLLQLRLWSGAGSGVGLRGSFVEGAGGGVGDGTGGVPLSPVLRREGGVEFVRGATRGL